MAGLPASHFPHRLMLNGTIRPRMCNNIAPSPASFCNQMFDQINTNWNFFRRPTLSDNDPIKVIDFLPKYSFPKKVTIHPVNISPGIVSIFQFMSLYALFTGCHESHFSCCVVGHRYTIETLVKCHDPK